MKIDDDIVYIEKKFIIVDPENVISKKTETQPEITDKTVSEEDKISIDDDDILDEPIEPKDKENEPVQQSEEPETTEISIDDLDDDQDDERPSREELQSKLKKTLDELNDIKSDMKNTFTSTETISSTISSIRGMIDAIRKDQLQMQESMKAGIDPKRNMKDFMEAQEMIIKMGEKVLENTANNEVQDRVNISKEWLKRVKNLLGNDDISIGINEEHFKIYPNGSEIDKFTNKVWFDSVKFWTSLVTRHD